MPNQREISAALEEVRSVYRDLAAMPIERNCTLQTECCQFKRTGIVPNLTSGEAFLAARAMRASGRKKMPERDDGACPMLDPKNSRCLIYADRPFGCRTHFCEAAGGPYTRKEVLPLIRRLEVVDAALGNADPRPLPSAVRRVLPLIDGQRSGW